MADNNRVDELNLGISIGKLDNSQIKNLQYLSNTLKDLDKRLTPDFMKKLEVLSNIKINVDTNQLNQLNNQIKETATTAENVKKVVSGGIVSKEIKQDTTEIEKLRNELKGVQKDKDNYIKDYKKGLETQLGGLTPEFFDKVTEQDKKYQETIKKYDDSIKGLRTEISEKQSTAKQTVDTTTSQETLKTITEITNKEQLYNAQLDLVKKKLKDNNLTEEQRVRLSGQRLSLEEKLKKIKEKAEKTIKQEAKDSEKSTKEEKNKVGVFGKLGKTIGRIAIYRAIRATLKQITQTIRQGVQALAQFSPEFNQTMTQLMSAGKNLRMSFVSAVEPIITAVTPFLVNVANSITTINNKIAEAIAYMKDEDYYYGVNIENQEEYNKAVDKLSFDKFDVLQQSGYNGFTKMAVDTEKMAKNASIFENIKSLVETYKEALSSVKEPLKTLWDIIKGLANEYGNEIIAFLKNCISFIKFIWEVLGDILKALQKVLESDFVKTTLHYSLSMITSILEIIKGSIITIYEILKSIFTMDFDGLGSRIKEAFDFTSIGDGWKSFGNSFIGFWKKFGNGTKNFFEWLGQSGTWSSFQYYANGGVPDVGTLFYAGEAGAEIVANTGHGTGVMNMEQLRSAVANGMREALYSMRQPNSNETIEIKISDETLFTTVRNSAKRRGLDFANV